MIYKERCKLIPLQSTFIIIRVVFLWQPVWRLPFLGSAVNRKFNKFKQKTKEKNWHWYTWVLGDGVTTSAHLLSQNLIF